MLRLEQLDVEDFGPFKGQQSLRFPEGDGVVVVYGENMRGKTSLLNALRFALFGRILTRGSRPLGLHQVGNWEAAAEGRYGFSVRLRFTHESHTFELTRAVGVRKGVAKPSSDADYRPPEFLLARDRVLLGPEEGAHELQRIMPEQVSRFFLFDGELLQEYEELLRNESEMGEQIARAIERILGVPVITSARGDLAQLRVDAQKEESRIAKRSKEAADLGDMQELLIEKREHHLSELQRLARDAATNRERKSELEEYLRRYEKFGSLLGERDHLEKEIGEMEGKRTAKIGRLQEMMSAAWRAVLAPVVASARDEVREHLRELDLVARDRGAATAVLEQRTRAVQEKVCPVCGQPVEATDVRQKLEADIGTLQTEPAATDPELVFGLQQKLALLADLSYSESVAPIIEVGATVEEYSILIADRRDRAQDISSMLETLDPGEYRAQKSEYERAVGEIRLIERAMVEERAKVEEADKGIEAVEKKLDKAKGPDLATARSRARLCARLHELFGEAVNLYRDRLRKRVETDASALFVRLTTEPEYAGLRINISYGLTIVHQDGTDIPIRSAGAEHVVALSLMGALQRNAPLRGPIIMDSPFGRLDEEHTKRVVMALPEMADQVLLLVYERELSPSFARPLLVGRLRSEVRLVRESARQTRIAVGGVTP